MLRIVFISTLVVAWACRAVPGPSQVTLPVQTESVLDRLEPVDQRVADTNPLAASLRVGFSSVRPVGVEPREFAVVELRGQCELIGAAGAGARLDSRRVV